MNNRFIFLLLLISTVTNSEQLVEGKYKAVFETHYGVEIDLSPNNSCEARQILYPESEEEETDIHSFKCNWTISKNIITMEFKDGTKAHYQYIKELSGLSHGSNTYLPGLIPLVPHITENEYLWRFPE